MKLRWPQLTYLCLSFVGLGFDLAKDGQEVTRTESFGTSLLATAIVLSLLYCGGFFGGERK